MFQREYTEEELHAAWLNVKKPGWPPLFKDAIADPWILRLIKAEAEIRARRIGKANKAVHILPGAVRTSPPLPKCPPLFDRKRAASGEREDD